jgi:hypothetical protein
MNDDRQPTDAEIDELVSHVLALRKDFVQDLLRSEGVPFSGLRKSELRERLREAIDDGSIDVADVVGYLDEVEPGGKQHVFLLRAPNALNDSWKDPQAVRRRLGARAAIRGLLDASTPLLMPAELELSRIRVQDGQIEIVGVEARRYFERDESYDRKTTSDEGLPVELRAHVLRVARTTVVLRWNTATRHAALHMTQASGRGLERDHYRNVATRFASAVKPWLDFSQFRDVDLRRVIHELHRREKAGRPMTTSRRGRWETPDGSEIEAVSASARSSVFADRPLTAAIGQVETTASGQSGNFYWLPTAAGPLTEELHLTILAFDSRVHFHGPELATGGELCHRADSTPSLTPAPASLARRSAEQSSRTYSNAAAASASPQHAWPPT